MPEETAVRPKFLTAGKFAERIGVTPRTVQRWDETGDLKPHHRSPKGTRYYTEEQVREYLNGK